VALYDEPISARRFPPPWTVEDIGAAFVVTDSAGQELAYALPALGLLFASLVTASLGILRGALRSRKRPKPARAVAPIAECACIEIPKIKAFGSIKLRVHSSRKEVFTMSVRSPEGKKIKACEYVRYETSFSFSEVQSPRRLAYFLLR
jgi:hypothetical protein